MAKTIASKKAAIDASLLSLANPRLCLLSAVTAETLHDPSTWTEVVQYKEGSRISLAGKLPAAGSAAVNTGDNPDSVSVQIPAAGQDVDCPAITTAPTTVVAIAVVDGVNPLSASTVGRIVDIVDKTYTTVGDVPRFAAQSMTVKE